ncbi:putative rod shape-determining protein MreD [Capnocytophaga canis]|uniref:Rod shape-determining protein MreD n=1 Tax=Capnocytophaga canis TaxID=1848903 RepID=A0A0B7INU6_9FLAO|nr:MULTISPECIES: hypothetical protein [Capnocytophaga]ATA72046.1 rod shape-determining protein MreD [Capnocytophaga sp. H4358]RIY37272.1 rod shape-determining protein MreD [Capnocytophaga canis]CEN43711.1 putative rod shape-determining protein MreD [Capnocytophaga canis]CEN44297.1 putative rod shape-determining protein MreD [Capnocytophaga canis]CEN53571.1 putative rod shape-determining protein MreD [Capnocytophaga canis]
MNNIFIKNTVLFVVLLLLQVLIFNNISYWGYVNPMVYLLFIILSPYRENRVPFLFASFLLGLCVDIFSNTGGLHAASSVFVAYFRSGILTLVFGKNLDYQEIKLQQHPFTKVLVYVVLLVILHHILFYFLEIFNFNHLLTTFARIGVASFFTTVVCLLFIYIFSNTKK